jgi:hypothetical protein
MFEPEKMMVPKSRAIGASHWYGVLIAVVILSLTCSLATRFSIQVDSHVHGIKSTDNRTTESKQHLDQDHTQVAGPVATAVSLKPTAFFAYVIPAVPVHSNDGLPQSLYNRPPPSSQFSL